VLRGVALFTWDGSAWQPAGRAQPSISTPSGVLEGVAVYTWSGTAWTPAGGTPTPSTPTGSLRGIAAFTWDGAAWQPAAQARPGVPTPYGVLDGVALFNWTGGSAWVAAPPPTPPTVLLMHADGTAGSTTFTDASPKAHTLTPTSVTVTATSKFGSGAANFTASSTAVINTGNATDFQFGAAPFTVEAWGYGPPSGGSADMCIMSQIGSAGNRSWSLDYDNLGNISFSWSVDGSFMTTIGTAFTWPAGTWVHFAADCDAGGTIRVYANGVVKDSLARGGAIFPSSSACLLGNDGFGDSFHSFLDDIRIVKGRAMYGGAFTPPTAPFSA
jgi:hypothetical protein